jgi:uncharacterized protein (TIGR02246 family)
MLVLAACGGSPSKTGAGTPQPSPSRADSGYGARARGALVPRAAHPGAYLSEAQRRAVEDTVRKLIDATNRAVALRDVGALMRLYPDTGALSSAYNGRLVTSRDSVEATARAFFQDPKISTLKTTTDRVRVDVLAPDAAAFTVIGTLGWSEPTGKTVTLPHAWSGVFVNRGGRWVILQEHDSGPAPTPTQ